MDSDGTEKIKINEKDIIGIINKSSHSNIIKKALLSIYDKFFDDEFGRKDIIYVFGKSKSSASNYLIYLQEIGVIKPVKGKGRYRFN